MSLVQVVPEAVPRLGLHLSDDRPDVAHVDLSLDLHLPQQRGGHALSQIVGVEGGIERLNRRQPVRLTNSHPVYAGQSKLFP